MPAASCSQSGKKIREAGFRNVNLAVLPPFAGSSSMGA